jgi:5-deoxy-glucuronate isomerase
MTGAQVYPGVSTPALHRPAGSLAQGPWSLDLSASDAGWSWSSLRVLTLGAGSSHTFTTQGEEILVLPLAGSCAVECEGTEQ